MVEHGGPHATVDGRLPATARDRALTEDVFAAMREHRQFYDRRIAIAVSGGVAHVSGRVRYGQERRVVRAVIARVRGIHAVWDVLSAPEDGDPVILDIGCGPKKQQADGIGVDCHAYDGVDVVADVERGLPFADSVADQIYAIHVLEHVHDLVGLMNDIHRVLKAGGILHAMVPNASCANAHADPTHVRCFNLHTFKYFCMASPHLRPFRPVTAAGTADDIYADLEPVKAGDTLPSDRELARVFG